jgi:hypothetical protein
MKTNIWARNCKRFWSPGIDSEKSVSPTYVAWRAGTKNRVVVPARQAGNRFLVSLKGLQIRALAFNKFLIYFRTSLLTKCIICYFWKFDSSNVKFRQLMLTSLACKDTRHCVVSASRQLEIYCLDVALLQPRPIESGGFLDFALSQRGILNNERKVQ